MIPTNTNYKKIQLNTIEDAIQDIKDGKIIIVVDDYNFLMLEALELGRSC